MSDIAKAREAAIAAETKVELLFHRILDRMHALNLRLTELHDEIKASQPVASGSVCLELYACGQGCNGCPHPRWVQYNWSNPKSGNETGFLMSTNLDAQEREPILALKRKSEHYLRTAGLIREAKSILVERAQILSLVRSLRYAAKA